MTIKIKKHGKERGMSLGFVVVFGALAITVASFVQGLMYTDGTSYAPAYYSDDTTANAIISQITQLQRAAATAAADAPIAWTSIAENNGRLALANSTQDYVSSFSVPSVLVSGTPRSWTLGSFWQNAAGSDTLSNNATLSESSAVFTVNYAALEGVSLNICRAINSYFIGAAPNPNPAPYQLNDYGTTLPASPPLAPGNTAYSGPPFGGLGYATYSWLGQIMGAHNLANCFNTTRGYVVVALLLRERIQGK